mgnify:CR=1 FL=1
MINKRIFGATISDKVKDELTKRQSDTGEVEFGQSVNIPQTTELNSRTPFIRMWTAVKLIEPLQVKDKLLQLNVAGEVSRDEAGDPQYTDAPPGLSEEQTEHGGYMKEKKDGSNSYVAFSEIGGTVIQNFVTKEKISDITRNQINHARKIYTIGNYNQKQDYATLKPNESTEQTTEDYFDKNLSTNPLLKPQSGIKSLTSETEGSLGLTKTTTVQFTVHNFYDYDRIYNKYFLKPGARIWVDYGWSDIDNLYDPNNLIDSQMSKGGVQEFLYGEKDTGDNVEGVVTKNAGNFEVINGIVKDYNSKMMPDGSVECEVTLISSNSALLSFKNDDETCKQVERMLDVGIYYLGLQRVIETLPEDSEERDQLNKLLVPDSTTSAKSKEQFEKNLRINAAGVFSIIDQAIKEYKPDYLVSGKKVLPVQIGLAIVGTEIEDAYISWGLFEDYIINNTFGHGASPNEINGAPDSIRLDSSSEFTAFSKSIHEAHIQLLNVKSSDIPKFIWPEWWGQVGPAANDGGFESYTHLKNKYPSDQYSNKPAGESMYIFDKGDDEFGRIPIREVFVKASVIKKVFTDNKNKPIKKIIEELLKKMNEISEGLFNLKLVLGNTESQAKIIDINYTQNELIKEEANANQSNSLSKFFTFKIMSPTSMVKNFNLEFKLPGGGIGDMYAIKGMSVSDTIDSNDPGIMRLTGIESIDKDNLNTIYLPDDGSFRAQQRLNKDVDVESFDIYSQVDDLLDTETPLTLSNTAPENPIRREMYAGVPETEGKRKGGKVNPKTDPVLFNNQKLKESGFVPCNSLNEYYNNNMKASLKSSQIDLLPYTLELNIYGISSIVPGDTFRVDYLPKEHLENTFLQTMKVSQKVDSSGWDTTLQTQYRPFYPEYKGNIFNSIVKNKGTSRLSPTCLIKEFGLKADSYPNINDSWFTSVRSGDRDSLLDFKEFAKHITDVSIEKQSPDSQIDFILSFRTSETITDFIDSIKGFDGLIHHSGIHFRAIMRGSIKEGSNSMKSRLEEKGFTVEKLGVGITGDDWMNQWGDTSSPDIIYYKEKKKTYLVPAGCILYPNTYYKLWISNGMTAIIKPNGVKDVIGPDTNFESTTYKNLKKFFQSNANIVWKKEQYLNLDF